MKKLFCFLVCVFLSVLIFSCLKKPDKPDPPIDSTEVPAVSNLSRNIEFPKPGDAVVVSATVTAPEGAPLSSVTLKWTVNGANSSEIAMSKGGSGDVYSGTVSGQFTDGTAIAYTVTATNKNGTESKTGNYTVRNEPPPVTRDYFHLALNEINGNGEDSERYIELYNNSSDVAVLLEGVNIYYNNLSSEPEVTWEGGKDIIIHPKGFMLLQGTKETGDLSTGLSHKQGIIVEMVDPDGNRIDIFKIDEDESRMNSYSRIPDGTGKWYLTYFAGTPGITNGANFGSPQIPTNPIVTNFNRDKVIPTPQDNVKISATVKAFSGTTIDNSSVVIKWTLNDAAQSNIVMTKNGDVYTATVETQASGSKVEYTLVVTNNENERVELSSRYFVFASGEIGYNKLVINEIDGNSKFVELYNNGTESVPLAGVFLVKNEQAFYWWIGSDDAYIAPKGFYAIAQTLTGNPNPPSNATEYTGRNGISTRQNLKFELWSPNGTDKLDQFIRTNGGKLGDRIDPDYSADTRYSFSRYPDGTGGFGLAVPSCNAPNTATAGNIEAY